MSKRTKIFTAIIIVVIIAGIGGAVYFSMLNEYRSRVDGIQIGKIDLTQIQDGVYKGSSDAILVSAAVEVTVENNRIVHIDLEHNHGRGEEAEVITDRVIDAQSLDVDIISGSTASSKVILDAIQNALAHK